MPVPGQCPAELSERVLRAAGESVGVRRRPGAAECGPGPVGAVGSDVLGSGALGGGGVRAGAREAPALDDQVLVEPEVSDTVGLVRTLPDTVRGLDVEDRLDRHHPGGPASRIPPPRAAPVDRPTGEGV